MEAGGSAHQWSVTGRCAGDMDAQVADEVDRLERLKPRLMQLDDGRDLLSAVNAQLRVLQEGLDERQVVQIWGENDEQVNPNCGLLPVSRTPC